MKTQISHIEASEYSEITWYNGYTSNIAGEDIIRSEGISIIFGLEHVIEQVLEQDVDHSRGLFRQWLQRLIEWENSSHQNKLYLIGCDIGKGIVPIDSRHRSLRDLVGWCYQDIVERADRVDVIWYGINQRLK
ncbi:bifunctional adenosylcobinamide kinase/adenosylcobinamide-phosphate guanylyltransferase [Alkalihalophilus pseudofirmus]|uniref:bifunctional adenosylcobinamide kinase/adenosylcobinamide-phosphate guanylyltransferase n=1 Tax=Alkalihalophilus pseudofirmus TaxID=79885 RepID=UPI00259BE196|nr:bifunctional adenosylcobinamide kinase/adenosylcobinamide-phosphate guanylyltransferase [Alkalihalophilus pseudofirmus]WEG18290.1 bifunctional adenosylcobinamide kinase/adenosylcobinamide-phosphate guanylyltransferase [Alkalihalophilus pseudofirmus]